MKDLGGRSSGIGCATRELEGTAREVGSLARGIEDREMSDQPQALVVLLVRIGTSNEALINRILLTC
jgi:hypothetical protein